MIAFDQQIERRSLVDLGEVEDCLFRRTRHSRRLVDADYFLDLHRAHDLVVAIDALVGPCLDEEIVEAGIELRALSKLEHEMLHLISRDAPRCLGLEEVRCTVDTFEIAREHRAEIRFVDPREAMRECLDVLSTARWRCPPLARRGDCRL
ncbi:MAG: hypothetical protein AB7T06_07405 [Kofleriaceae bacterium]